MNRHLTVRNATTSAQADLVVAAAGDSPAAPLLAAFRSAVGAGAAEPLSVAGHVLSAGDIADCDLRDGDVVTVGEVARAAAALVDLVVHTGPDAGRCFELPAGRYVVGRDPAGDVVIDDPGVSARHLGLEIGPDHVEVADLGATNQTRLDGTVVSAERISRDALPAWLDLGDTSVSITAHWRADDRIAHPGGVTSGLGLGPVSERTVIMMPAASAPVQPSRVAVLPATVPIVAGGVLAVVLHQWEFVAFTAMSPLMIIGQAITDRRSARRQNRAAEREHGEAQARADREVAAALVTERERRHRAAPDLGELCSRATRAGGPSRYRRKADPDGLRLRLGQADQPSDVEIRGGPPAVAHCVPLIAPMAAGTVLGITGPARLRRGLARSLVIQAATKHDPADLSLVVLAPGGAAHWGWVRWLPHAAPHDRSCVATVGFDADQITSRLAELRDRSQRLTLVVVDGASPAAVGELPGAAVIWCAPDEHSLPLTCDAAANLTRSLRPRLTFTTRSAQTVDAVPDLLAGDVATTVARGLARRPAAHATAPGLPAAVRWGELAGRDERLRWGQGPTTEIVLGVGDDGPTRVDLAGDGPHAVVAGTTGAGKSELLLTLIAELASRNRPDQLSFLLVDHKGGAAFGACARLPHVVGMVTDLDPTATRRALQSIGAELLRREQLLAAAGVADFATYLRTGRAPSLTRLVIVVDEFAALVGDEPGDAAELVAIAQRGRSLGLHLVLATQRPEGLVSADIRANARIRICLGVTRDQDSRDVIDSPAAAAISRTAPGRAYLRIGPGELHLLQTARVTAQRPRSASVSVTPLPDAVVGDRPPDPLPTDVDPATELDELIDAALAESRVLGCEPVAAPWLPPLPQHLDRSTLPAEDAEVAWGLADLPRTGRQSPLVMSIKQATTTLIVGTTRSGRSTAAVSIALAMADQMPPDDLHVWGIDAAIGMSGLAALPHCGAVIPAADQERVRSLLDHLAAVVQRRREGSDRDRLALLVLVDGWEAALEAAPDRARADIAEQVLRLATDGPSVGLHLVITGGRSLLTGRLAGVAGERVVLRLADPADYLMLGLPRREVPTDLPPGRGVRASDLALVQVAAANLGGPGTSRWPPPATPPATFAPLPRRVALGDLRLGTSGNPRHGTVVLGVGAGDLAPVELPMVALGEPFTVLGSRRSGRSTALRLIGEQLPDRAVVAIAHHHSPLAQSTKLIQLDRDDPAHDVEVLARLDATGARPHLLVDDVDQLAPGPLLDHIEQRLRASRHDGAVTVISAATESAATAYRGPLAVARPPATGLLLRPTAARDGDLIGIDLRRHAIGDDPPGRGWLTLGGAVVRVQLAEPEADPQPSTELELSALGVRRRE